MLANGPGALSTTAPVAEDGHHLVVLTAQVTPRGDAQRRRDRGAGVPGAEGVVVALRALEEAGEAPLLAEGLHARAPPREELVRVALVAEVPHQPIPRRVEDVVQRDRELDDAEPRADVPPGAG